MTINGFVYKFNYYVIGTNIKCKNIHFYRVKNPSYNPLTKKINE